MTARELGERVLEELARPPRRLARYFRQVRIWWSQDGIGMEDAPPRPTPPLPEPEPRELIEARMRFKDALNALPRDQAKINRLRRRIAMLEVPNDPARSGIHRRGVSR